MMSLIAPEDPQRRQQERAAREIASSVQDQLLSLARSGEDLTSLGPGADVALLMVSRLPVVKNPWADIVGSCYTSGSLQRELGIKRGAVSKAVKEMRLLRLSTSDGKTLYPTFQVRHGRLVPGLDRVLRELSEGINDPWTWAQWLNTEYEGARAIDRIAAGDIESVVLEARNDAAAWAA